MRYHSPITILNAAFVDAGDAAAVSLLRKKMMAELELSDDKIVRAGDAAFGKNDLLLFFDSIRDPVILNFHRQIFADAPLLSFLETGKINGAFADNAWYKDTAFLHFIAPYYEPLFTAAVLDGLKHRRVNDLQLLFNSPVLLNGEQMAASYNKIFRLLKTQYNRVEAAILQLRENPGYKWEHVQGYADRTQIQLLNALPAVFHEFRSNYGVLLINLALPQPVYSRKALEILYALRDLKTTAYVQELVEQYIPRRKRAEQPIYRLIGAFEEMLERRGLRQVWVLKVAIVPVIVSLIIFGIPSEKKWEAARVAARTNLFTGSRTYWTMEYLLSQLEHASSQKIKERLPQAPVITAPRTGDDLYGPDFMAALRRQGDVGSDFTPPPFNGKERQPEMGYGPYHDPAHRQSLLLYNRIKTPVVALVQTPDSFYSCYIASYDSAFLPLPLSLSRVYFYAGSKWSPQWSADKTMDYVPSYRLKGIFLLPAYHTAGFLRGYVLQLNLDSSYWKTSGRYIPVILSETERQQLQAKFLTGNFNGVEMMK